MKRIILVLAFLFIQAAYSQTFDFNKSHNPDADRILKKFIENEIKNTKFDTIAYFYDIDNDGKNELIGIVKSNLFYSLEGYKLFALKKNNSSWDYIKSDVYFDTSQEFKIQNKKITFHKSIFYKNKKCSAKYKNNSIKTSKSLLSFFERKKAQNLEEITKFQHNEHTREVELVDLMPKAQKSVNINYVNLDEKTKHYLELK